MQGEESLARFEAMGPSEQGQLARVQDEENENLEPSKRCSSTEALFPGSLFATLVFQ